MVSWLTTMMGLRLQVVLEHMPVGPDAILRYVRRVGDPPQVKDLMMGYGVRGFEGAGEILEGLLWWWSFLSNFTATF